MPQTKQTAKRSEPRAYSHHAHTTAANSPQLWSPRMRVYTPRITKKGNPVKITACPEGFHKAVGWKDIKDPKKFCLKDCHDWNPPMVRGARGRCARPKTAWMKGLLAHYQAKKAENPSYKYSQAMVEYKKIYQKQS